MYVLAGQLQVVVVETTVEICVVLGIESDVHTWVSLKNRQEHLKEDFVELVADEASVGGLNCFNEIVVEFVKEQGPVEVSIVGYLQEIQE